MDPSFGCRLLNLLARSPTLPQDNDLTELAATCGNAQNDAGVLLLELFVRQNFLGPPSEELASADTDLKQEMSEAVREELTKNGEAPFRFAVGLPLLWAGRLLLKKWHEEEVRRWEKALGILFSIASDIRLHNLLHVYFCSPANDLFCGTSKLSMCTRKCWTNIPRHCERNSCPSWTPVSYGIVTQLFSSKRFSYHVCFWNSQNHGFVSLVHFTLSYCLLKFAIK